MEILHTFDMRKECDPDPERRLNISLIERETFYNAYRRGMEAHADQLGERYGVYLNADTGELYRVENWYEDNRDDIEDLEDLILQASEYGTPLVYRELEEIGTSPVTLEWDHVTKTVRLYRTHKGQDILLDAAPLRGDLNYTIRALTHRGRIDWDNHHFDQKSMTHTAPFIFDIPA